VAVHYAQLRLVPADRDGATHEGNGLIYRLKHWPALPRGSRTADIFRALSVMSSRPVNRRWILTNTRLRSGQVDELLQRLIDEDAVEVVDGSKFAGK
jgi:hypothetical protein